MKTIFIAITIILSLFLGIQAFAAGTCVKTIAERDEYNGIVVKKIACTADSGNGSFPATTVQLDGFVLRIETDPGETAPQAGWDIVLNSALSGADILLDAGANRSATASEATDITTHGAAYVGSVSMAISGNNVNSALIDVYIFIVTSKPVWMYQ